MENSSFKIHHYTDLSAMTSILGKEYITLRATNVLYLNDSRELHEGIEVVEKIENRKISSGSFRNYYITSFSHTEDCLTMWGMYAANGSGCILSFDHNIIAKSYEVVAQCTYGEEATQRDLKNFLNLTDNGAITNMGGPQLTKETQIDIKSQLRENLIITTCLQAKNEAYSIEEERRGIIHCNNNKLVKFRVKNNTIIPYIDVAIPKEALKSIIIGPTNNSSLTMQSIIQFLMINGYNLDNVEVRKSKIPYRG